MRPPHHHGRLVANNRHDGPMFADIGVQDEAHRGFRAIYETANIRFLSKSHLGECLGEEMATLLASRDNIRQVTSWGGLLRRKHPGFP